MLQKLAWAFNFDRQYDEDNSIRDDHERAYAEYIEKVYEETTKVVDEKWEPVRQWIIKGNAGGVVASLALVGSQVFSGILAKSVVILVGVFIVGLWCQLFRNLIIIRGAQEARKGEIVRAENSSRGFKPGLGYTNLPRILDGISLVILMFGCGYGFIVLWRLSVTVHPGGTG
ncbi:hypothetical protein AUP41_08520 [Thalassospira xiamenensis]|nr:hypothetical protein AUP41_08520 [Thalassospira xiamenensis]